MNDILVSIFVRVMGDFFLYSYVREALESRS